MKDLRTIFCSLKHYSFNLINSEKGSALLLYWRSFNRDILRKFFLKDLLRQGKNGRKKEREAESKTIVNEIRKHGYITSVLNIVLLTK